MDKLERFNLIYNISEYLLRILFFGPGVIALIYLSAKISPQLAIIIKQNPIGFIQNTLNLTLTALTIGTITGIIFGLIMKGRAKISQSGVILK